MSAGPEALPKGKLHDLNRPKPTPSQGPCIKEICLKKDSVWRASSGIVITRSLR